MPKAIAIERNDGTIDAICVHGDGLVEPVIEVAVRNYKTEVAVSSLIALGDLSQIGRCIGEKHDFNSVRKYTTPEWCLAYHRDRGEPWEETKPTGFASRAAYAKQKRWLDVDRLYLFDPKAGQWYWFTRRKWAPVPPLLRASCRC